MLLQILGFLLLLLLLLPPSAAESPACCAAYRSGGAAAALASPDCPFFPLRPPPPPPSCDLSTHQGRRRRQEDRAVCALDLRIPFLGRGGVREVGVSVVAVFDGHNGDEASEMASRLLLEYFLVHVYFLLDGVYSAVIGGGGRLMIDDGAGEVMDADELWRWPGSDPERSEQTYEYTPPEALLNANWFQGPQSVTLKYDMWSVGVVMLEMILGSPHVFQISGRTRALLDHHLDGWSDRTKELAYKLRSYMEMCILIPGISPQHHPSGTKDHDGVSPASWKCSEESFSHQVKSRDPLNLGFPNVWALRLVRQLLVWHPEDRLSVDDALLHPYFKQHS